MCYSIKCVSVNEDFHLLACKALTSFGHYLFLTTYLGRYRRLTNFFAIALFGTLFLGKCSMLKTDTSEDLPRKKLQVLSYIREHDKLVKCKLFKESLLMCNLSNGSVQCMLVCFCPVDR